MIVHIFTCAKLPPNASINPGARGRNSKSYGQAYAAKRLVAYSTTTQGPLTREDHSPMIFNSSHALPLNDQCEWQPTSNRDGTPHLQRNMVSMRKSTCSSRARPKSRMSLWPSFNTTHTHGRQHLCDRPTPRGWVERCSRAACSGLLRSRGPTTTTWHGQSCTSRQGTRLHVPHAIASTCAFKNCGHKRRTWASSVPA